MKAAVIKLLARHDVPLLTLTGPPGIGKTRMSLEVAASFVTCQQLLSSQHFPDGAWFVGLAPVTDPALVASGIAQVFGLTRRESEVAALIARSKSNAEIAEALVVSKRTVETHIGNILSKLDFTSRGQIAAWAMQKGLVL